jgi:hypothetical protein
VDTTMLGPRIVHRADVDHPHTISMTPAAKRRRAILHARHEVIEAVSDYGLAVQGDREWWTSDTSAGTEAFRSFIAKINALTDLYEGSQ